MHCNLLHLPIESPQHSAYRKNMYKTLEDFIGNTPLVRLQRMPGNTSNVILLKLEGNNPAGSVKDRPAFSMIKKAEARGEIRPGDTLIEATSGNTGIALAMAAATMGYRMVLVMPEHLSIERRQSMAAYGAEIVLTPKAIGMEGARDVAETMRREGRGLILDQFSNPDNPLAHYEGTGRRSRLLVYSRSKERRFRAFASGRQSMCRRFVIFSRLTESLMSPSRKLKRRHDAWRAKRAYLPGFLLAGRWLQRCDCRSR